MKKNLQLCISLLRFSVEKHLYDAVYLNKIVKKLYYDIIIKKLPYGRYSTSFINPFSVSKQFPIQGFGTVLRQIWRLFSVTFVHVIQSITDNYK